jgi:two-component system sensor histidine kinase/response regulator
MPWRAGGFGRLRVMPSSRDTPGTGVGSVITVGGPVSERADQTANAEPKAGFGELVEGIPGAVYRRALEQPWRLHYVSDAVESIIGFAASELVAPGVAPDALTPEEDDLATVADAIRLATSAGRPYDLEYRVKHADGTIRWVHDRGQPERDASGVVAWLDGVIFDITERKHAEHGLEQQRVRLVALMENIPDHIYFKDADSRFTMVSHAMARSFGLREPA